MSMKVLIAGMATLTCAVSGGSAGTRHGRIRRLRERLRRLTTRLSLKTGYGGGGRVGIFLDPRWSIEFEDAEMRATPSETAWAT